MIARLQHSGVPQQRIRVRCTGDQDDVCRVDIRDYVIGFQSQASEIGSFDTFLRGRETDLVVGCILQNFVGANRVQRGHAIKKKNHSSHRGCSYIWGFQ